MSTDVFHVMDRLADAAPEHPDTVRLRWLANTVLFCDYGDNSAKEIGWRVYEFVAPLMYGASINQAIDAARAAEEARPRRKPSGPPTNSNESGR